MGLCALVSGLGEDIWVWEKCGFASARAWAGRAIAPTMHKGSKGTKKVFGDHPLCSWGVAFKSSAAPWLLLENTGGSGVTTAAGEQQSDVLLSRQDSRDSLCRECTDNYSAPKPGIWGCN